MANSRAIPPHGNPYLIISRIFQVTIRITIKTTRQAIRRKTQLHPRRLLIFLLPPPHTAHVDIVNVIRPERCRRLLASACWLSHWKYRARVDILRLACGTPSASWWMCMLTNPGVRILPCMGRTSVSEGMVVVVVVGSLSSDDGDICTWLRCGTASTIRMEEAEGRTRVWFAWCCQR